MTGSYDRRTLQRWLLSIAIVLLVHGGVAGAIVHWHDGGDDAAPNAAIVIDLAPTMMAPEDVQEAVPPGPEQVQADAAPEHKVEQVEEKIVEDKTEPRVDQEPQPDIARAENPEVVLAPKPPEPKPEPVASESQAPAPVTTAPQVPKVEDSRVAAAPVQAQLSVSDSTAIPNWKRQVVARLERNKRYPAAARTRNETGTAQLAFSLDRQGKVMATRIVKSSGSAALDAETLELVRRAQPFPPPPAAIAGVQIDLTVPIRFNVH
jgi:protein TonB